MKTLSKFTISAMLILYGFVGFTILSPLISAATGNPIFLTIGLLFSLYFVLLAFFTSRVITVKWTGIFSRLGEEEASKTWLLLHSFLTFAIGQVFPWLTLFSSMMPLFLVNSGEIFPGAFMSAWIILLLSIFGLWSLHLIIGMGYRWFCEGTTVGIRSFSNLALQHLRNKKSKGITYLRKALIMLQNNLKHEKLELQELNNTIKAMRCFTEFQSDIPYDSLQMLAHELRRFPSIEHLPEVLSTFNRSSKVLWTGNFATIERTKRTLLELIVVVAAVLSGLTFLPETARSTLLEILQSVGSAENIRLMMGFLLFGVIIYITSLIRTYDLNPFEAKEFKLSEAKLARKEDTNGP